MTKTKLTASHTLQEGDQMGLKHVHGKKRIWANVKSDIFGLRAESEKFIFRRPAGIKTEPGIVFEMSYSNSVCDLASRII